MESSFAYQTLSSHGSKLNHVKSGRKTATSARVELWGNPTSQYVKMSSFWGREFPPKGVRNVWVLQEGMLGIRNSSTTSSVHKVLRSWGFCQFIEEYVGRYLPLFTLGRTNGFVFAYVKTILYRRLFSVAGLSSSELHSLGFTSDFTMNWKKSK